MDASTPGWVWSGPDLEKTGSNHPISKPPPQRRGVPDEEAPLSVHTCGFLSILTCAKKYV
ncbi:hypothetical protein KDW_26190 [Dictyobacter vulcani]|uniref:Uncharacterized protein n=1 Tax=Dictyobacter vulcani TaxID=2607529 RepID=A0A5J4KPT7_9CHLR|nr:hypothetical protein KDW_26190 [Dictyobacter vulcani]